LDADPEGLEWLKPKIRTVPAGMPPPESGARERLGGPASLADQGLQARENQPADG